MAVGVVNDPPLDISHGRLRAFLVAALISNPDAVELNRAHPNRIIAAKAGTQEKRTKGLAA